MPWQHQAQCKSTCHYLRQKTPHWLSTRYVSLHLLLRRNGSGYKTILTQKSLDKNSSKHTLWQGVAMCSQELQFASTFLTSCSEGKKVETTKSLHLQIYMSHSPFFLLYSFFLFTVCPIICRYSLEPITGKKALRTLTAVKKTQKLVNPQMSFCLKQHNGFIQGKLLYYTSVLTTEWLGVEWQRWPRFTTDWSIAFLKLYFDGYGTTNCKLDPFEDWTFSFGHSKENSGFKIFSLF